MARKVGNCPKCNEEKNLTRHHIFPRTHFKGNQTLLAEIILICRECHDDLEYEISMQEGRNRKGKRNRLRVIDYVIILQNFIRA